MDKTQIFFMRAIYIFMMCIVMALLMSGIYGYFWCLKHYFIPTAICSTLFVLYILAEDWLKENFWPLFKK